MFKRLFFLMFMMGSVAVPYLISSSSGLLSNVKSQFSASDSKEPAATAGSPVAAQQTAGSLDPLGAASFPSSGKPQKLEGLGTQDLNEVLQFNGTPAWVMARWPRVTAGLAELDLQGYRVPLVTGTAEDDLAGSLTYYFDKDQQAKYISFHGTTGDPRKLIALVMSRYNFRPQQSNDPSLSLYQVKWNGKPVSELLVRPARVVRADQPHARYQVDLALKRP